MIAGMTEWLTVQEAAAYLKLHSRTLYRYVKADQLPVYRPGGTGRPRFRRVDLDAFLLRPSRSAAPNLPAEMKPDERGQENNEQELPQPSPRLVGRLLSWLLGIVRRGR